MLSDLMDKLTGVSTHEDAAHALLTTLLDLLDARLARFIEAHDLERGIALRALLHYRPELGYRGLVSASRPGSPEDDVLLSTRAWELVRRIRRAVGVDVEVGRYSTTTGEALRLDEVDTTGSGTFQRLKQRQATHFLALPVRLPRDQFLGMVTLEISCPDAAGTPFGLWADCEAEFQRLVDLTALYLDRLPMQGPPPSALAGSEDGPLPAVSPQMASVLQTLRAFSTSSSPLLLLGESGTGKTHLARWCHHLSSRKEEPFVVASLYQVSEEQAQALLFGVKPKAFTGVEHSEGYAQEADGGTLFIDEIGDLSPKLQLSLLRLLDERRYQRLGETLEREANIRIIAATNVDLRRAVRERRFRSDLWHRLEVLPVEIPPMRERLEELGAWGALFLRGFHEEEGRAGAAELAAGAVDVLRQLPLEGNLRTVRTLIERAYTFARLETDPNEPVRVSAAHLRRAADLRASGGAGVMEQLQEAAEAYLARHEKDFESLKGVFLGMVLWVALQQGGDPKEVARRLGFGDRIRGGNHLETFRRYGGHLRTFAQACGAPADRWLIDL
jgi:DNA-binding NtrC family response regulator